MIRRLLTFAAGEPLLVTKVLGSLLTVAALFGIGDEIDDAARNALVGLVIAGLAFYAAVVRSAVVSAPTLAQKVEEAAEATAAAVTTGTAGAAGTVTAGGRQVVAEVVEGVVGTVGGIAGGVANAVVGATNPPAER